MNLTKNGYYDAKAKITRKTNDVNTFQSEDIVDFVFAKFGCFGMNFLQIILLFLAYIYWSNALCGTAVEKVIENVHYKLCTLMPAPNETNCLQRIWHASGCNIANYSHFFFFRRFLDSYFQLNKIRIWFWILICLIQVQIKF